MSARLSAFFLWAAAAACLVFWGMRVLVGTQPVPGYAQPVSAATALRGDVARLFAEPAAVVPVAAGPAEPALASRFKLVGVMAPKAGTAASDQGIALIEVDGKPARPYRIGARLDTRLVLQAVGLRTASIGTAGGPVAAQIELPRWTPPATGSIAIPEFTPVVQPPPGMSQELVAPQMQSQPQGMPPSPQPDLPPDFANRLNGADVR